MVSSKRSGRDLSPRDAQEHKKVKHLGDSASKQKSQTLRKSGSSTPDSANPGAKASLSNRTWNQIDSRSSASASGSRSGSPTKRRASKTFSDASAEVNDRPPLRVLTTPTQAANGQSEAPASAKEASSATSEQNSRPALKRANTISGAPAKASPDNQSSVSLPPPRGPAPTAPMMGLSPVSVPGSAKTSSVMTPSTATEPGSLAPTGSVDSLFDVLTDKERLSSLSIRTALKKDQLRERLAKLNAASSAGNDDRISELQRNVKTAEKEFKDVDKRLNSQLRTLEATLEYEIHKRCDDAVTKVKERLETIEGQQKAKAAKLRASLAPLQLSESPDGVINHDELETMIRKHVKEQLAATLKGPLSLLASDSTSEEPSALVKAPKAIAPSASIEVQSELSKMKKDLEAFKQTISSKDKERDSKIKTLENENARLKGQVTQLQGTVQNATKEISSLTNSVTDLKREKAGQNKVASLEQQVNSNSDALKNALSISTVVTKLQSEMKESKSIWDDVKRLRKDMNTTTDPRKRIFPTPAVDANANGRVEVLQKSVDALTQRIENQPAPSNFSNLQKDFEKMKKDSEKLKEEFKKAKDESSKVLDRHEKEIERHDECIDRHERDLRADNNRINEVNQDLSNLRDDLTKLNKKVREIDLDLEDLEWEVKKLPRANFDASEKMEGEVKNKQAEFAKIRDTVLRHDEDIKSLNAKVAKIPEKSTPDNSAALSVRLDHVEAKQDTQQNSINTAAQKIKTLEKDTKNHKNTMDDIKRKSDQKHTSLSKVVDGLQKRVNTIDDEQSALQEKVDSIDTTLERAADTEGLQRDVALLKSNHEAHTASIKNLDRILHGAEVMTNSESASLVQQLIDLKSTVHAMGQSYENQPRSNSAPAQQSGSAQQTSSPRLGVLEKRVTQVERDHASMKKDIGALRIDIDGFEEAVAQQSELIEEDVKQRVRHEVATAMSSAHQPAPQTPENVKHMIEESTGRIRNEMQELRQDVARRSATPRVQEVEDAIYSRLEQSASRVVDNKLNDLNKKLDGSYERYNLLSDHLAALSKLLEQRCPPGYSDILADLVMFSETQGRPSNFFWATITAIRDLQSRFDNLQTRELAVCILNGLMPHINQKLVQPLSQTLLEPIRNSIAANIGNEFKGDVKDVRANVELVKRKIRDIESSSKQKFDDLDRRVNTQTPASDTAVQDELRRLSQESHRSCAVINERIDKEIRTATDGIRNLWTTVNALSADYERDKPVIWEQLREHRDNIERAQEDFGGIQVCVCRLAKKVDPNLVPHSWFEMYET